MSRSNLLVVVSLVMKIAKVHFRAKVGYQLLCDISFHVHLSLGLGLFSSFLSLFIMLNYGVCMGCTNTNLSRHCVYCFPAKRWNEPVRLPQVKRQDFTVISGRESSTVLCDSSFLLA